MNERESLQKGSVDYKVIERRLAPGNNTKLRLALPEELRKLWTRISAKQTSDDTPLSVYAEFRSVLFTLKDKYEEVLEASVIQSQRVNLISDFEDVSENFQANSFNEKLFKGPQIHFAD